MSTISKHAKKAAEKLFSDQRLPERPGSKVFAPIQSACESYHAEESAADKRRIADLEAEMKTLRIELEVNHKDIGLEINQVRAERDNFRQWLGEAEQAMKSGIANEMDDFELPNAITDILEQLSNAIRQRDQLRAQVERLKAALEDYMEAHPCPEYYDIIDWSPLPGPEEFSI